MSKKGQARISQAGGTWQRFRGDEISKRIEDSEKSKIYPHDQLALLMNAVERLFAEYEAEKGKDIRSEEWKAYQELRAKIKAEVDAEFGK